MLIVLIFLLVNMSLGGSEPNITDPCQLFGGTYKGIWHWQSAYGTCQFGIISTNYIYGENIGMEIKKNGRSEDPINPFKCTWENEVLTGTCINSSVNVNGGGDMTFSGMITPFKKILLHGTAGTQSEYIDISK